MNVPHTAQLTNDDQRVLDTLIEAGFEVEQLPPADQPRARRIAQLLGLLEHLQAPSPGDLVAERTIQAVARARATESASGQVAGGSTDAPGPAFRWTDLSAVAAMILISLAVALPMLSHNRDMARQAECQANLARAGLGFSTYAADNDGQLPAMAANPGDPWWQTNTFNDDGSTRSNSAHLFIVVRTGNVKPEDLDCPSRKTRVRLTIKMRDWPDAKSVPFSYQNLFTDRKPKWNGPNRVAILADRNPLFINGQQDASIPADAPSPNHEHLLGQNALMNNGSVEWIERPVVNDDDNIWNARGLEHYEGNETPADEDDSFLVQ